MNPRGFRANINKHTAMYYFVGAETRTTSAVGCMVPKTAHEMARRQPTRWPQAEPRTSSAVGVVLKTIQMDSPRDGHAGGPVTKTALNRQPTDSMLWGGGAGGELRGRGAGGCFPRRRCRSAPVPAIVAAAPCHACTCWLLGSARDCARDC